jgi:DNA-directed RNA polymerase subunit RPC12/RpoP
MTLIPVPIMMYSLILTVKNYRVKDTSMEDREKATEKFEQNYICPACKKFVGNIKYNLLIQYDKCPKCGTKFLHE